MDLALAPFTLLTLAVTVIVTVAAFQREELYESLMFSVDAVLRKGEWWRLFTSALIHADWPHLIFNVISLLSFGFMVEHAIHTWRFALLYILGVMVASFTSLILYRDAADYRAVGASGGVCAVIGCSTVLFPDLGMYVFFVPIAIPAWIVGAAFIVYSVVGAREQWDNVGHAAHLGGTLFGIGFATAFYPEHVLSQWWYAAAILAAGAAAWAYVRGRNAR